jgi:hypothetical protein
MNEQYHATFRPTAFDPTLVMAWPVADRPARAVHDALGAAMVARLPAPTLAARCGEIGGRRTDATSLLRHVELIVKHILTFSYCELLWFNQERIITQLNVIMRVKLSAIQLMTN